MLRSEGMTRSKAEPCAYASKKNNLILSVYVDDLVIIAEDEKQIADLKSRLNQQFDARDLGEASHILSIRLKKEKDGKLTLDQTAYADDMLETFNMHRSVGGHRDVKGGPKKKAYVIQGSEMGHMRGWRMGQVYLIMRQLQQAGISPKAFILERYDLEPQREIRFFDVTKGTDVQCGATPFGYSRRMKEELAKDIVLRKKKDSDADEDMDWFTADPEDDEDFTSVYETVLEESKDPSEEVLGHEASDDWGEHSIFAAILACLVCLVPLIYFLFYVLYFGAKAITYTKNAISVQSRHL
ncbi:hypothetical protein HPB49_014361 [Dermacentor silvarum]|uniref:Uncharacterized protein n=1 Tax=Dermacentor silvarum TaxID=543639 RepID=A0ACB8DDV0_DERSI|nr:hypothetical protein HPB49_014361 [Dermacentor silvarum]